MSALIGNNLNLDEHGKNKWNNLISKMDLKHVNELGKEWFDMASQNVR